MLNIKLSNLLKTEKGAPTRSPFFLFPREYSISNNPSMKAVCSCRNAIWHFLQPP